MMQHFIQLFTIQMAILEKSCCTFTEVRAGNIHEQIDQIKSHWALNTNKTFRK